MYTTPIIHTEEELYKSNYSINLKSFNTVPTKCSK